MKKGMINPWIIAAIMAVIVVAVVGPEKVVDQFGATLTGATLGAVVPEGLGCYWGVDGKTYSVGTRKCDPHVAVVTICSKIGGSYVWADSTRCTWDAKVCKDGYCVKPTERPKTCVDDGKTFSSGVERCVNNQIKSCWNGQWEMASFSCQYGCSDTAIGPKCIEQDCRNTGCVEGFVCEQVGLGGISGTAAQWQCVSKEVSGKFWEKIAENIRSGGATGQEDCRTTGCSSFQVCNAVGTMPWYQRIFLPKFLEAEEYRCGYRSELVILAVLGVVGLITLIIIKGRRGPQVIYR